MPHPPSAKFGAGRRFVRQKGICFMGTRADFYIGRGETAEWIGSIAMDGYPSGIPLSVLSAGGENGFRLEVENFLNDRDDSTFPEQGWPWPWKDSKTTDYAYAFDGDKVFKARFGYFWHPAQDEFPEEAWGDDQKHCVFPDMTEHKNVAPPGDSRSGVMTFSFRHTA